MSRKLTITIPDELHYHIECTRHRFNISKVCSEAIRIEHSIYELLLEENVDRIKMLKIQKEKFQRESRKIGQEIGVQFAKDFSYAELVLIIDAREYWIKQIDDQEWSEVDNLYSLEVLPAYIVKAIDNHINRYSKDRTIYDVEILYQGFGEGILQYWNEVEPKLK